MAGLTTLLDIADSVAKAGIEDDGQIASILQSAGFDSADTDIQAVKKLADTVTQNIANAPATATGAITSLVNTTGNITSKVVDAAVSHPYVTGGVALALTGATVYGAYELNLQNNPSGNPFAITQPYKPGATSTTVPATQSNQGILTTILSDLSFGLFGNTPAQIEQTISNATPWLIAGGVVVAVIAVGYTVNSFKSTKPQGLKISV